MIRIEPSVQSFEQECIGFGVGFDVDWWKQTRELLVVEIVVVVSAFRVGRLARLRIGYETGARS